MTDKSPEETNKSDYRVEHDLLGELRVPADAYYGIQTARALQNFHISGVPISIFPDLIRGMAIVKRAAAWANHGCGQISEEVRDAIDKACAELIDGKLHDQFGIDVVQGGAGTSTNMNANEVIANRALELMGYEKGNYEHCSPLDHVNRSQSTNDAYPTALKVAIALVNKKLIASMSELAAAFDAKGEEFSEIVKMGRTQLQDAVPMTLGQEFHAWAKSLKNEIKALDKIAVVFETVNMGGTAIGTGLNAPKGFADSCAAYLSEFSKLPFRRSSNLVESTQSTQPFVLYGSTLKSLAIKLSKICNDLRLLSSGPRTGLCEILLPPMQPGSSIMPGKVNPVIPEVVNMVCFRVIGNDQVVTMAAEAGQLQLNVMEPIIARAILESQTMFMNAARTLRENCVDGIEANRQACEESVNRSIGVVTALNPVLGYKTSTQLAAEALDTGKGIVELVREKGLLTEAQIQELLDPAKLAGLRRPMRPPKT